MEWEGGELGTTKETFQIIYTGFEVHYLLLVIRVQPSQIVNIKKIFKHMNTAHFSHIISSVAAIVSTDIYINTYMIYTYECIIWKKSFNYKIGSMKYVNS